MMYGTYTCFVGVSPHNTALKYKPTYFRKNFSKATLNRGVDVCRSCHSGIYNRYDEMTLAKPFSSLDTLMQDTSLQKYFQWVAKQKVKHYDPYDPCKGEAS